VPLPAPPPVCAPTALAIKIRPPKTTPFTLLICRSIASSPCAPLLYATYEIEIFHGAIYHLCHPIRSAHRMKWLKLNILQDKSLVPKEWWGKGKTQGQEFPM
jgi:hypothetical protein